MTEQKKEPLKLKRGELYWDRIHQEVVEFGYMGQTGLAIVYKPGDSGGGMQSSWGVKPDNLEEVDPNLLEKLVSKP